MSNNNKTIVNKKNFSIVFDSDLVSFSIISKPSKNKDDNSDNTVYKTPSLIKLHA